MSSSATTQTLTQTLKVSKTFRVLNATIRQNLEGIGYEF